MYSEVCWNFFVHFVVIFYISRLLCISHANGHYSFVAASYYSRFESKGDWAHVNIGQMWNSQCFTLFIICICIWKKITNVGSTCSYMVKTFLELLDILFVLNIQNAVHSPQRQNVNYNLLCNSLILRRI